MKTSFKKLVLLFVFFGSLGCGSSGADCDVTAISKELGDALGKYFSNQTKENCLAYKSVLERYLKEVDGCDLVSNATIEANKKELAKLTCQ
jgi:hypothetical protein